MVINMAKLKFNEKIMELDEGTAIKEAAEVLGVPFSCENGVCCTCLIEIKKGEENLSELTPAEIDNGLDKKHRLACQVKIKEGDVEIEF